VGKEALFSEQQAQ